KTRITMPRKGARIIRFHPYRRNRMEPCRRGSHKGRQNSGWTRAEPPLQCAASAPRRGRYYGTRSATMSLSPLTATIDPKSADRQRWGRLHGAAASLAAASAAQASQQPLLGIARDTASARRVEQELRF